MAQTNTHRRSLILLTGATGYIGGRLLNALEGKGYPVRCLARRPECLRSTVATTTEVVQGDVLAPTTLPSALAGVHTAYYLVHSMGSSGAFEEEDRQAARNFAEAARRAGVRRIIYLGGLASSKDTLSPHLRSRHEVGDVLRESGLPVIEFRSSIVIGSGSLSFEMIRALVERLPIMITPRWVSVLAQPIAIDDLLAYLLAALQLPEDASHIFEIGGADQMSYGDLMREYARQRGLPRVMIRVPVLTPRLSSLWLGIVTPLYARVGRKIVDSIRHPTIVEDTTALRTFPIRPIGMSEAIARALRNEDHEFAQTRWSDALSSGGPQPSWGGVRFGSRLVDSRIVEVPVPPTTAFTPIRRIGGTAGWYYGNWLWALRGFFDILFGGVGVRRGRRDPEWLRVGDTVDWWRVEVFEPDRRLRLWAEMKLPGRAWLEFEVEGNAHSSTIRQTAIFDPVGLSGLAYWYLVYPLHQLIFAGMLRGIVTAALEQQEETANAGHSVSTPHK
ncbi:MAG: SDR family oxidoreductase [Candidatus Binatia bacterium]